MFITPDSIVPNPRDGQDYNRYTYVRNNPIRYNDPSGNIPCHLELIGCGSSANAPWQPVPVRTGGYVSSGSIVPAPVQPSVPAYESCGGFGECGSNLLDLSLQAAKGTARFLIADDRSCRSNSGTGGFEFDVGCGAEAVVAIPFLRPLKWLGRGVDAARAADRAAGLAPRVTSGATNAADYARLLDDLEFRQAASIFDDAGGLKPSVIGDSRSIISGERIGNPQVIDALTSDGSRIADWAKYSTSTVQGPSGPFQVHFYYNSTTGVANYEIDYKVVFNSGVGG